MIKEKLRMALNDAVEHYNAGLTADEAIIKSAQDHKLTIDQTDRVIESFNTAKAINYYEKNAGDRTGGFDLASKKAVTLKLFGKSSQKQNNTATKSANALEDAFYASMPDRSNNKKNIFTLKRASALDKLAEEVQEKWAHTYSDNTLHGMASDTLSVIRSAKEDLTNAINTLDNYIWDTTEKIAADLSHGAYEIPEDRANLFKVACPYEKIIDEVSKRSPLLKKASGGRYRKDFVVDTTPIDNLLKEAENIATAETAQKEYKQKLAEFTAKEEKLRKALFKDPYIKKVAGSTSEDPSYLKLLHKPAVASQKTASFGAGAITGFLSSPALDTVSGSSAWSDVAEERLRDDMRGAMLADLLSSDPILQDADPRHVASIYKSLVATSPRVSLNKEVVRSVLRSAVNSIALSPNDSKVLTDLDKGVQTAYMEPKKDTGLSSLL